MSWNNGYERKKFEQEQKAQAKEYRKCGMNEEQIQAMYLQDLQEYRNNRVYAIEHSCESPYIHIQESVAQFPLLL